MAGGSSKAVIKDLKAAGWRAVRQKGSHIVFRHAQKPGRIVVPHPKRDLPRGTLASIYRAAGLPPPWKR